MSVWEVAKSTMAAFLGVQTEEARRRDFTHGNPAAFIIAGIVGTVIFILVLVAVVSIVLHSAGA
ncbi:MAG TPA: DUF2970 domain-containing protein [Gammaproteobacteria bacterium]|nr:DUF2970 domain-containing protein [Gammaproteobacteria bacterium]